MNCFLLFFLTFNVFLAIFVGDDECFEVALEIVTFSPQIGPILKLLLGKCVELLAYEYTEDVLNRSLRFLSALAANPYSQNGQINEELSYLSQIFESLLLGPSLDVKYDDQCVTNGLTNEQLQQQQDQQQQPDTIKLEHSDEFQQCQQAESLLPAEDLLKDFKVESDQIIKKECEDFFMMMDTSETVIKKEEQADLIGDAGQLLGGLDELPLYASNTNAPFSASNNVQGQITPEMADDDVSIKISEVSSEPEIRPPETPKMKLTTVKCHFNVVENLCRTIGMCAGHWGYLEQHLTYLMSKRVDKLSQDKAVISIEEYWESLYRIVSGLWSLGEYSFRELTIYFDKIDPAIVPEYLNLVFARTAIFLKGRSDIFLYEYLQEICGDTLLPFMTFFPS